MNVITNLMNELILTQAAYSKKVHGLFKGIQLLLSVIILDYADKQKT